MRRQAGQIESRASEGAAAAPVLDTTATGLADLRRRTERRLAELVPDPGPGGSRAQQAMHYALLSPGRRLRAQLTLLTASCLGGADGALDAACALEMIHAASLIMDDLPCMDDTGERRGRPATHVRFGEPVALLATIGLVNGAYATLAAVELPPPARLAMIASLTGAVGLAGLVLGQEQDLDAESEPRPEALSPEGLAAIHRRKTGVLFTAAVEIGALAAAAQPGDLSALRGFAAHFGVAFQILDDLQDSQEADPSGGDEAKGRPSAVAVLGSKEAERELERRLAMARRALGEGSAALTALLPCLDALLGRTP